MIRLQLKLNFLLHDQPSNTSEKKTPTQIIKKCDNVLPGQDPSYVNGSHRSKCEHCLIKQNWRNVDKTHFSATATIISPRSSYLELNAKLFHLRPVPNWLSSDTATNHGYLKTIKCVLLYNVQGLCTHFNKT
jgi:hypothetical protein